MTIFVILLLLLLSIILAVFSLIKQKQKLKELDYVDKELKKKRVIYHQSSKAKSESRVRFTFAICASGKR